MTALAALRDRTQQALDTARRSLDAEHHIFEHGDQDEKRQALAGAARLNAQCHAFRIVLGFIDEALAAERGAA